MKDSKGIEHYGDVWPLTANYWEGVCDCGYRTTPRRTSGMVELAIERHVENLTGQYTPAQVHAPLDINGVPVSAEEYLDWSQEDLV